MITQHYSHPESVDQIDVQTIAAATATIDVAAYSLTNPKVIAAILARAQAGIKVRLYLDRSEVTSEARGDAAMCNCALHVLFNQPNIAVLVKQSMILMHLKSYLVDGSVLRDGSANFSVPGEEQQDNSLTLTDDAAAVAAFKAKFEAMWARPDNLSVAGAIASPGSTFHRPHHQH